MFGNEIDVYMDSIGQTITEYLVNFDFFKDVMKENGFEIIIPDTISPKYSNIFRQDYFEDGLGQFETGSTATAAATGTWVHLVVRYDRGAANMQDGVSFYVNGVADAGTTDGGTWVQNADINPASSVDSIGRRGSSSEDLDGKIAVMRIYNKKLSASEIEQNFTVQRQRFVV